MTPAIATDVVIAVLIVGIALWALTTREIVPAVIGFMTYGLVLTFAWVRLSAIDVAMTEAAIGAGATGMLLLRAAMRLDPTSPSTGIRDPWIRIAAVVLCVLTTAALAWLVLGAAGPPPSLAPAVLADIAATGMENGVTAVLMAYRGLDTLLEKVVLAVALVAVWSLTPDAAWGGRPGLDGRKSYDGVLVLVARILPPLGVLIGIYLVWAGANEPGGAFQGGTIIGVMWVLVILVGLKRAPRVTSLGLRGSLVIGAMLFILVGLSGFLIAGGFLSYPPSLAKPLIIAIEAGMTLSIAATIAMLVLGPPQRRPPA
jgi:multisubunit Na+/H+ antiporter MnhB subunit